MTARDTLREVSAALRRIGAQCDRGGRRAWLLSSALAFEQMARMLDSAPPAATIIDSWIAFARATAETWTKMARGEQAATGSLWHGVQAELDRAEAAVMTLRAGDCNSGVTP